MSKWIPISERLPKEYEDVLVTYVWKGKRFVKVDHYDLRSTFKDIPIWWQDLSSFRDIEVIAWMPLPEPYKEENEIN